MLKYKVGLAAILFASSLYSIEAKEQILSYEKSGLESKVEPESKDILLFSAIMTPLLGYGMYKLFKDEKDQ